MPNVRQTLHRDSLNPRIRARGFMRSAGARGFVMLQMIAGAAVAAVLVGMLGYTLVSMIKSGSNAQRTSDTRDLLRQAAYTLTVAAVNADADDAREPLAGTDYTPGAASENPSSTVTYPTYPAPLTNDGWYIPKVSAAPKVDAWGGYLKYCVWDNGSANTSTGRLTGDATATYVSAVAFAVISAGPDKMMQTTCAQAKAGTPQGDDVVRAMTNSQIVQGVGGTAYLGDAVADATALATLPTVQPGQMRTDLSTGTIYVNKSGNPGAVNWTAISGGGGGGGGGLALSTQPSYASITALTGPIAAGQMYFALDTGALYVTRVDIPAGQSGQQYWQMLVTQADTNPAVTVSGASSHTFVTNFNYTASPVSLTTASGGTGTLKYNLVFDTPVDASLFFPPLSFDTNTGTFKGTGPASTVSSRQARIIVTDTRGRFASQSLTLAVSTVPVPVGPVNAISVYARTQSSTEAPAAADTQTWYSCQNGTGHTQAQRVEHMNNVYATPQNRNTGCATPYTFRNYDILGTNSPGSIVIDIGQPMQVSRVWHRTTATATPGGWDNDVYTSGLRVQAWDPIAASWFTLTTFPTQDYGAAGPTIGATPVDLNFGFSPTTARYFRIIHPTTYSTAARFQVGN